MLLMNTLSRRGICLGMPALAAAAGFNLSDALAQAPGVQQSVGGAPVAVPKATVSGNGTLGPARGVPFDSVTATPTANGGDRRVMLRGSLETGEKVEVHQSTQMPGTPAPAMHVVRHSEMILVREGTLKFDHEVDGKVVSETVGPGGVFYVAYGTKHAASNVGSTPARYFVVQIGGDVK